MCPRSWPGGYTVSTSHATTAVDRQADVSETIVQCMPKDSGAIDGVPTVTCSRCDRSWDLEDELGQVGNRAVEQFALDHHRHTGHYPDDVTPWLVDCERCPETEAFLSETPARRWARTHTRHTRHPTAVTAPEGEVERVTPAVDSDPRE